MIVLLAVARFALVQGQEKKKLAPHMLTALAVAIVVGFLSLITNSAGYLRFYPVCINAWMFALFFLSLLQPPSMTARFARLAEPYLPETGVWSTRQVTKIWCALSVSYGEIGRASCRRRG